MGRILIADDEEFCIESLKIMLKKAQLNIDKPVDIVIDGLATIQKMKRLCRTCLNSQLFTQHLQ